MIRMIQLLTAAEVARRLRITTRQVYYLTQRNEMPVVRIGASVRIPEAELEQWIKERMEGFNVDDSTDLG